jgi:hypothetical protein
MRIVGWCRENGLAYQSLVNDISAGRREISQNSCSAADLPPERRASCADSKIAVYVLSSDTAFLRVTLTTCRTDCRDSPFPVIRSKGTKQA